MCWKLLDCGAISDSVQSATWTCSPSLHPPFHQAPPPLLFGCLSDAARACKADADKHCSVSTYNGFRNGTIIGCLRDIREKLQGKCAKEIFRWGGVGCGAGSFPFGAEPGYGVRQT
jgi:hypothetical protein